MTESDSSRVNPLAPLLPVAGILAGCLGLAKLADTIGIVATTEWVGGALVLLIAGYAIGRLVVDLRDRTSDVPLRVRYAHIGSHRLGAVVVVAAQPAPAAPQAIGMRPALPARMPTWAACPA